MDRKKYTFRYGQEIEKLLAEAQEKYSEINTMNALLEKLIYDAIKNQPEYIRNLSIRLKDLEEELRKEYERSQDLKETLEAIADTVIKRNLLDQEISDKCKDIHIER